MNQEIVDNIQRVRDRLEKACQRVGRPDGSATLIGITKTFAADTVNALIEAGVTDVGENRIQEFLEKKPSVNKPCRWHFVGSLQRNKAIKAIGQFELIHSVDRVPLAQTLSRLSVENDVTTRILLEVNTSGEKTKHGFKAHEVVEHVAEIAALPNLTVEGLMTIGPLTDDQTSIRRAFQSLFRLREKVEPIVSRTLPHLSMGMSGDFETAVEEGATLVRLGRALLGARPQ